ncbi:MAG: hypothetical protein WBY94_24775, partial [Polyangiaceae bacterium]
MSGLGSYLVVASIIHAGLFVYLPTSGTQANAPRAAVASLDLEVESSVRRATPGGGALAVGMNAAATAPTWVPVAPTPVPTATKNARPAARPVIAGHIDRADEDERSAMTAAQSSDARREREMAMAAAAASDGVGRGAGGGPGGDGAGWGAPPIRGRIAFGNGTRGDLTGRVCFLPIGTLRIKDVRSCEYVATIYT